jgi:8-oxo-dGTP pyrophosphatase MutT (NUDIX family)
VIHLRVAAEPWIDVLMQRLSSPPRRVAKRFRFAPQLSYGRHRGPAPPQSRAAAVMLLVYPREGRWFIPFTLRPLTLSAHGGQVSLPGGTVDVGESAESCGLRELQEEIGVQAAQVSILGTLSPIHVHRSGFLVRPLVAASLKTPEFHPNPAEVEQLLEIPVEDLLDDSRYGRMWIVRGSLRYETPCFHFSNHRVWGATLKIVGEFLDLSYDLFGG